MADSMAALDLMNQLVHQEGRSELTGSLARYLGMRGGILRAADSHDEAWDSFAAGAQLLEPMVQGGRGDLLPLLLGAVGDLASEAPEARKEKETAERANTALGLLKQAVDAGHVTEVLREAGKAFCADIGAHMGPLAEAGLDVETFIEVAKQLGILDDVADDPASGD